MGHRTPRATTPWALPAPGSTPIARRATRPRRGRAAPAIGRRPSECKAKNRGQGGHGGPGDPGGSVAEQSRTDPGTAPRDDQDAPNPTPPHRRASVRSPISGGDIPDTSGLIGGGGRVPGSGGGPVRPRAVAGGRRARPRRHRDPLARRRRLGHGSRSFHARSGARHDAGRTVRGRRPAAGAGPVGRPSEGPRRTPSTRRSRPGAEAPVRAGGMGRRPLGRRDRGDAAHLAAIAPRPTREGPSGGVVVSQHDRGPVRRPAPVTPLRPSR